MLGVVKVSIKFENHAKNCKDAINQAGLNFLEEAGGEVESQTKKNCKVVTGKTKGSFSHIVDEDSMTCAVGSNYENAIWEEFGTGIYAVEGDGRQTPWIWTDDKGQKHLTHGKKPRRMLFNAFNSLRSTIQSYAEEKFGGIR